MIALIHPFRLSLAGMALVAVLSGCIIGGTGTDTGNGLHQNNTDQSLPGISASIRDSAEHPVPGIVLTVIDPLFRPDTANGLPLNYAISKDVNQKSVVTNARGQVNFSLSAPGTYIIEGSKAGQTLFFDTLRYADAKAAQSITLHTRLLHAFKGKVRLASGMHIDSGKVFIRGTSLTVKVDTAGLYDLGLLPSDMDKMGIGLRFHASPTKVLEIHQDFAVRDPALDSSAPVVLGQKNLKVVYVCSELSRDSSAKAWDSALSQKIDTGNTAGAVLQHDSVRVSAALKSCDSIPTGTVVNLKPLEVSLSGPATGPVTVTTKDSVNGAFLVPSQVDSTTGVTAKQILSYGQCVGSPGAEITTLDVKITGTLTGTDLLIGDLDQSCRIP